MHTQTLFKFFVFAALFFAGSINASHLLEERNFNVTLNLSKAHYLIVSDLDFRVLSPAEISESDMTIESTTGRIAAYSNSPSGYFVTIGANDPEYISDDGYSFVMRGNDPENPASVSFLLNSSYNPDGTLAPSGSRTIYPGDTIIEADGACGPQKVMIDIWATLLNSNDIFEIPTDFYNAILTTSQFADD